MGAVVIDGDHVTVHRLFQHHGHATGLDMFLHQRVVRICRDIADRVGIGEIRHLEAVDIVGIQHHRIGCAFNHDALDDGQFLDRVDATQT